MSEHSVHHRRASERLKTVSAVQYFRDSLLEIDSVENEIPVYLSPKNSTRPRANSTPNVSIPEKQLPQASSADRLNSLRSSIYRNQLKELGLEAQRVGFPSLLHAGLAEARQHCSSNEGKKYFESLVVAGYLEELMEVFREGMWKGEGSRSEISRFAEATIHLHEAIYVNEFNNIRNLEVLNHSFATWEPEYFAKFNFVDIYSAMQECAPNLIRMINMLTSTCKTNNDSALTVTEKRYVVMILAQLANLRNNKTNFIQGMFALYLFASNVPQRSITPLNHLGISVSIRTLRRFLRSAAVEALKALKRLGPSGMAFIPVIDNLNKQINTRFRRLNNDVDYLCYTAGFILYPAIPHPIFSQADFFRDLITTLILTDFLPTSTDVDNISKSFSSMLWDVFKLSAKKLNINLPQLDFSMPVIFQIDRSKSPRILPSRTLDLNEGETSQMIEILNEITSDVGLSQDQCINNLSLFCGDLNTVQNIRFGPIAIFLI